MTTPTPSALEALRRAAADVMTHQWSNSRAAMDALTRLVDAASGAAAAAEPNFGNEDGALPALRSLVRTILTNAHAFQWSLQGMGMLRLHLPGDYRLHVWDRRYRTPNVSMIHDHLQWGLHSTIVAGEMTNCRYVMAADGEPYVFGTLKPGQGCFFKDGPNACYLKARRAITYGPGGEYEQQPEEIHQSDPLDGTVTLMHKRPTADESARVFWRAGEQWVSAEPRPATPDEVAAITGYALERWFGGSAPATSAKAEPVACFLADLLREALGPLEVSAALIEDEDGGERFDALVGRIKAALDGFDASRCHNDRQHARDAAAGVAAGRDVLADLEQAAARKWQGAPACQQAGLFARAAAELRTLRAKGNKAERRAIMFGDCVHHQVLAMRAAVVAWQREDASAGMKWIANTLCGPGHLPSEEAIALGAQALFDKEMAEHEAFRAANPGPTAATPAAAESLTPPAAPEAGGA